MTECDLEVRMKELTQQRAEIDKQLAQVREEVISRVQGMIKQFSLTPEECGFKAKKSVDKDGRKKVTPKYRNKNGPETWSGRGVQPGWVRDWLAAGNKLEDLLIEQPAKAEAES